jgi:hypothetical protein
MAKALNDNFELTFTRIGLAAARVVERLDRDKERNEDSADDCERSQRDKQKSEEHSRYIDHRLHEIRAWERRVNGKG